ncbi:MULTISPECIES: type II toxin-antitoxin system PemK/MazF family toxin [Enterococcus]|uniref:mRNA interferase n=1 Tax=Enterococcus alishanensis TaxID=1303817 RepID=A0ABS6TEK4_9ENTE|nr:type II toxin-antitoxin system PemK/MazF family toxin [Enterococcus alishanensis]MBV7391317.1 type II toxin-antitoxin system PemK/MazF family toxin [Enterococcus alishanensis]
MVKRGDIYFADLSPVVGSEQGGIRPVLVIQNNLGNHFSPTIIVAAITAKMAKPKLPTHIGIESDGTGIERDSVILLEQIRTIDKCRLKEKVCHLEKEVMEEVDAALRISVGIETMTVLP